jgi:hypothetical protein
MKFNSLKYSKKLRLAGFNESQYTILAERFDEHISHQDLATTKDVIQIEKNIDLRLIKLNQKIDAVGIRLEKSIADLGTKLTTLICASSFSMMTILLAFMMFLHSGK